MSVRQDCDRASFERYLTLRANLTLREVGKLFDYVNGGDCAEGKSGQRTSLLAGGQRTSQQHGVLSRADFCEALRRAAPMRSVVHFRARLGQNCEKEGKTEGGKYQFWQQNMTDENSFCQAVEPWGVPICDALFVYSLLPNIDMHGPTKEEFDLTLRFAEALTLMRHISSAGHRAWRALTTFQEIDSTPPMAAAQAIVQSALHLPAKDASILVDFAYGLLKKQESDKIRKAPDMPSIIETIQTALEFGCTRHPLHIMARKMPPSPSIPVIIVEPSCDVETNAGTPHNLEKRKSKARASVRFAGGTPTEEEPQSTKHVSPKGNLCRVGRQLHSKTKGVGHPFSPSATRGCSYPEYVAVWQADELGDKQKQHARAVLQKWNARFQYDMAFANVLRSVDDTLSLTKQLNAFAEVKDIVCVHDFLHHKGQPISLLAAVEHAITVDTWMDFVLLHRDWSEAVMQFPFPLDAKGFRDHVPLPWVESRRLFEHLWEGHDLAISGDFELAWKTCSIPPVFPDAHTFCSASNGAKALQIFRRCGEHLIATYGSLDQALMVAPFGADVKICMEDAAISAWADEADLPWDFLRPPTVRALIRAQHADPMRTGKAIVSTVGLPSNVRQTRPSAVKTGGIRPSSNLTPIHGFQAECEDNGAPKLLSPPGVPAGRARTPQKSSSTRSTMQLSLPLPDTPSSGSTLLSPPRGSLRLPSRKMHKASAAGSGCPSPIPGQPSPSPSPMARAPSERSSPVMKKNQPHDAKTLRLLLAKQQQAEGQSSPRAERKTIKRCMDDKDSTGNVAIPGGDVLCQQRLIAFSGSVKDIQVAICRVQDLFDKIHPKWRADCLRDNTKKLFQLLDTKRDNVVDVSEIKAQVEKLHVSDGVWTVLDADRICKLLMVGCVGTALNPQVFAAQCPFLIPVTSIPRLREHLTLMYGTLEDAFGTFDVASNPGEQFSIDEFETRLFPWGICDRDAQAIFRHLDAINVTGHISLLLLLCSIEHAPSFALLETQYHSARLWSLDIEAVARECASRMNQDGESVSPLEVVVDSQTFSHFVDVCWNSETDPSDLADLLLLRIPLFATVGKQRAACLTVAQLIRTLRVWTAGKRSQTHISRPNARRKRSHVDGPDGASRNLFPLLTPAKKKQVEPALAPITVAPTGGERVTAQAQPAQRSSIFGQVAGDKALEPNTESWTSLAPSIAIHKPR